MSKSITRRDSLEVDFISRFQYCYMPSFLPSPPGTSNVLTYGKPHFSSPFWPAPIARRERYQEIYPYGLSNKLCTHFWWVIMYSVNIEPENDLACVETIAWRKEIFQSLSVSLSLSISNLIYWFCRFDLVNGFNYAYVFTIRLSPFLPKIFCWLVVGDTVAA